jgi:4-hydroxy-3-methylbut-2-enyl diphosphate reductase IspH
MSDLRGEWFASAVTVGITAGTSTPDPVIEDVDQRIRQLVARASAGGPDAGQGKP